MAAARKKTTATTASTDDATTEKANDSQTADQKTEVETTNETTTADKAETTKAAKTTPTDSGEKPATTASERKVAARKASPQVEQDVRSEEERLAEKYGETGFTNNLGQNRRVLGSNQALKSRAAAERAQANGPYAAFSLTKFVSESISEDALQDPNIAYVKSILEQYVAEMGLKVNPLPAEAATQQMNLKRLYERVLTMDTMVAIPAMKVITEAFRAEANGAFSPKMSMRYLNNTTMTTNESLVFQMLTRLFTLSANGKSRKEIAETTNLQELTSIVNDRRMVDNINEYFGA